MFSQSAHFFQASSFLGMKCEAAGDGETGSGQACNGFQSRTNAVPMLMASRQKDSQPLRLTRGRDKDSRYLPGWRVFPTEPDNHPQICQRFLCRSGFDRQRNPPAPADSGLGHWFFPSPGHASPDRPPRFDSIPKMRRAAWLSAPSLQETRAMRWRPGIECWACWRYLEIGHANLAI